MLPTRLHYFAALLLCEREELTKLSTMHAVLLLCLRSAPENTGALGQMGCRQLWRARVQLRGADGNDRGKQRQPPTLTLGQLPPGSAILASRGVLVLSICLPLRCLRRRGQVNSPIGITENGKVLARDRSAGRSPQGNHRSTTDRNSACMIGARDLSRCRTTLAGVPGRL